MQSTFLIIVNFPRIVGREGGDRGSGARENRGRKEYGRRERKGWEAGILKGREAGEKCKTLTT